LNIIIPSRKNPEWARIESEARVIQTILKQGSTRNKEEELKLAISQAAPDGLSRWEIAQDNGFLIRSSKKYARDLHAKIKYYYYIDTNYEIQRLDRK
jgi:hypothetical protein